MKTYLGVDPGASGGLALLTVRDGSPASVLTAPMPATDRDVWEWIGNNTFMDLEDLDMPTASIEKVGGYIAGQKQPGSAMFKFGASYGGLRMALTAAGIPFEEVTPQKWQKGLGIAPRRGNEGKTAWKNRLKAHAQGLYPFARMTLAVCDALLIATYCWRKSEGKVK